MGNRQGKHTQHITTTQSMTPAVQTPQYTAQNVQSYDQTSQQQYTQPQQYAYEQQPQQYAYEQQPQQYAPAQQPQQYAPIPPQQYVPQQYAPIQPQQYVPQQYAPQYPLTPQQGYYDPNYYPATYGIPPQYAGFMHYNPQWQPWILPKEEEKEPMLLLDITGSMNFPVSEKEETPRKEVIREAIGIIAEKLGQADSQAPGEAEGGGLRTVTFSGGNATDIGDINAYNLKMKWQGIKFAGGTRIMPGWRKLIEVYTEEFGGRPAHERPILMGLIITDGDADDHDQFLRELATLAHEKIYVSIAIIGYGTDFNNALKAYKAIEANNAHVKAMSFGSETNPEVIAQALLRMVY